MSRMGDVLAGFHAAWEFESDSVLIRFERGIRTPKLLPGARRAAHPLRGAGGGDADPRQAGHGGAARRAAAGRRSADGGRGRAAQGGCDPYRLVLPAERETLAEYYADELRGARCPADAATEPADRYLVAAPEARCSFKAYDGKASFDGKPVAFRWFWTGASTAKWKAGDQTFPSRDLAGVEWRSPEVLRGPSAAAAPRRGPRSRPRPTRTRPPWSSVSGTARCTSRCRSRPSVLAAVRAAGPARSPERRGARRPAHRARPRGYRRPHPAPRRAAPGRPRDRRGVQRRRRPSCWRNCDRRGPCSSRSGGRRPCPGGLDERAPSTARGSYPGRGGVRLLGMTPQRRALRLRWSTRCSDQRFPRPQPPPAEPCTSPGARRAHRRPAVSRQDPAARAAGPPRALRAPRRPAEPLLGTRPEASGCGCPTYLSRSASPSSCCRSPSGPRQRLRAGRRARGRAGGRADRAAAARRDPAAAGLVDHLHRGRPRGARAAGRRSRRDRAWPWPPMAIVGYLALCLALALRERRRTAAGRLAGRPVCPALVLGFSARPQRRHERAADRAQRRGAAARARAAGTRGCAAAGWPSRRRSARPSAPGAPCWRSAPGSHVSCTTWWPTTCR